MFVREPTTERQRLRWLTLCDMVDNGVYGNVPELQEGMKERGFPLGLRTLKLDLYACNIGKFQGIYARLPIGATQEADTLLRARLMLLCSGVLRSGDTVVINTAKGGGPLVAFPLQELRDGRVLSVLPGPDAVWVLAPEGEGANTEEFLLEKWRDDSGLKTYEPRTKTPPRGAPSESKSWPGNAWERTRRADE